MSPGRAIVYGGLTAGALDLTDAFVFFYVRSGVRPIGILHSIASGLIGPGPARSGGLQTAALGLVLHFLIAFVIVTLYVVASRGIPILRSRPVVCGIAYGVIAYFVMAYVVVPLSNAGPRGPFVLPVFINGVLIHAFGVGLPAALFAARSNPREEPS